PARCRVLAALARRARRWTDRDTARTARRSRGESRARCREHPSRLRPGGGGHRRAVAERGGAARPDRGRLAPTCRSAPLANDRLQMRENLALELLERLVERGAERVATAAALPEAAEILDGPVETVPRDQVVGHEERELVGRQRAFLQVADGEATGRAERVEVELRGHEGSVRADAGGRDLPAVLHRVEPEAFEDVERDPLRHALRQPLLGASLALRQLDLGHVRELVSDQ